MRFLRMSLTVISMIVVTAVSSVYAEEKSVAGSASADVMSNYVWRGQKLSNAYVIQPAVGITYGVFGASLWGNYDSDKVETTSGTESGHGEFSEFDVTLSYARSVGDFTVGGGYIYYSFDGANDTQEVYLTGSYNGMLSPALTVYYDYDEGNGAFIVASVGHSFDLPGNTALRLGASAGYNIRNKIMGFNTEGDRFSGFYNGELSSSLTVPVSDHISVAPKIAYSFPLGSDAKDAISSISDDGKKDIVYGGVNITLSF